VNDGPDINTESTTLRDAETFTPNALICCKGREKRPFFRNDKPQRPSVCVCNHVYDDGTVCDHSSMTR
jgi:hypothetical protein